MVVMLYCSVQIEQLIRLLKYAYLIFERFASAVSGPRLRPGSPFSRLTHRSHVFPRCIPVAVTTLQSVSLQKLCFIFNLLVGDLC